MAGLGEWEVFVIVLALGGQVLALALVGVVVYVAVRLALAHGRLRVP